jgi:hypothetical protein
MGGKYVAAANTQLLYKTLVCNAADILSCGSTILMRAVVWCALEAQTRLPDHLQTCTSETHPFIKPLVHTFALRSLGTYHFL